MLLPDVWSYLEYWAEFPPTHELLAGVLEALASGKGSRGRRRKATGTNPTSNTKPDHGLTRPGDANPNALRAIAGAPTKIDSAPDFLREHIRKLVEMDKQKGVKHG